MNPRRRIGDQTLERRPRFTSAVAFAQGLPVAALSSFLSRAGVLVLQPDHIGRVERGRFALCVPLAQRSARSRARRPRSCQKSSVGAIGTSASLEQHFLKDLLALSPDYVLAELPLHPGPSRVSHPSSIIIFRSVEVKYALSFRLRSTIYCHTGNPCPRTRGAGGPGRSGPAARGRRLYRPSCARTGRNPL
jgi:hypothetical protein